LWYIVNGKLLFHRKSNKIINDIRLIMEDEKEWLEKIMGKMSVLLPVTRNEFVKTRQ